ncbi:MAG TPA: NAD(P)-dependent alcohol dehydrogenase [bacterium]|nr:NAD(P)-dependent alcohol dehydrogenase [bacterium]
MQTTPAYAARSPKEPLAPFEIQRREPGPNDVQIDIKFCGICHSDIHQARDEWGGASFPMVPGHEIAGIVSKVGAKVTRFKTGDHAGVGCLVDSCRECKDCKAGLEQYCLKPVWTYNSVEKDGKNPTYGGYSTRIVVDEHFVLQIPKNLPLDRAAPLLCAGITLYSPLRHWKTGPGSRVGVIGLGGLGHMGVKIAKALGADVTVLSHSKKKEADARRLGAQNFFLTSDPRTLDQNAGKFDLLVNTVPVEIDWERTLNLLDRDGALVLLGVPDAKPTLHPTTLILRRRSLAGSVIGGIAETQEMLDFCGKHEIASEIETIPIQKVNEAYERTIQGDVRYRFVIDLESLKAR